MHLVLDRLVHAQGFKIEALLLVFFQGLNKKKCSGKSNSTNALYNTFWMNKSQNIMAWLRKMV
jgi:hypothetical protein